MPAWVNSFRLWPPQAPERHLGRRVLPAARAAAAHHEQEGLADFTVHHGLVLLGDAP